MYNADVGADGQITVDAKNTALINATLTNSAVSQTAGLYTEPLLSGSGSKAAAIVFASNAVQATTRATLERSKIYGFGDVATPSGAVSVSVDDLSEVYSNIKLVAKSTTGTDGGAAYFTDLLRQDRATFRSSETSVALDFGDLVYATSDHDAGGEAGGLYRYLGTAQANFNLTTEDFSNLDLWKSDDAEIVSPGNLSEDGATAVGGAFVYNRVESDAQAEVRESDLRVETLSVEADKSATIYAELDSYAKSSAGSAFGEGASLAINGQIAANVVVGSAQAEVLGSTIVTTKASPVADHQASETVSALSTDDIVQNGTRYFRYFGIAQAETDLSLEDFADVSRWEELLDGVAVRAFNASSIER